MVELPSVSSSVILDGLKLYGRNPDQLDGLYTVHTFSDDIRMKFGLEKCAVTHFVKSKLSGHNTGSSDGRENGDHQGSGTGSSLQVLGCRRE